MLYYENEIHVCTHWSRITATKIRNDMSRKVFIKWILEGKQPPQKTFCESGAERKAKSPVKRFYCSFTVYMKVFANITHLDQNRQKCNPSIYSNPPLNLFRSISNTPPFPRLLMPTVFSGPKSMDFLFLCSSDFFSLLLYYYYLYHFVFGKHS